MSVQMNKIMGNIFYLSYYRQDFVMGVRLKWRNVVVYGVWIEEVVGAQYGVRIQIVVYGYFG